MDGVERKRAILLFDVDGTLTMPRQKMDEVMREFLVQVRTKVPLAVVGGSDLGKIVEQLGSNLEDVLKRFDFVFSENGLVGFHNEEAYPVQSIKDKLGEERLQKLINFTLKRFSEIELPVKRGNFVEFRNGMLNLSPIGRSCSQEERLHFVEYDTVHGIRKRFVEQLKDFTKGWDLNVCIGGQISVDVFPNGWDKTFCLQYLNEFDNIYFFGDKTAPGGNDHDIFISPRTIGYTVLNPQDTRVQISELLKTF
ncbi:putative phosphomannomutase [Toxocara canis]|uniref:Phosphomannomutase n=1 Tax=Toxocara canis TaxID=6265 RepID=A0A0B2URM6_TOXCA|nr:putative phosphomannomutase [Toxocara canis]